MVPPLGQGSNYQEPFGKERDVICEKYDISRVKHALLFLESQGFFDGDNKSRKKDEKFFQLQISGPIFF